MGHVRFFWGSPISPAILLVANRLPLTLHEPVTVAEGSKTCNVFARSEAGIVGSNPTQGMDVWCVYVFILCLCSPVFR
jgi:hypothetical protein